MVTMRQAVYMVLDLLKEHADDAYYTEDHVLFLLNRVRAYLLDRQYKEAKNKAFREVRDENRQTICLDLEPAEDLPGACDGGWLQSTVEIPDVLSFCDVKVYPVNDLVHSMVTYIAPERMPYVGHNKWLRNIIYCARSDNNRIYLHGQNPAFLLLEKVKVSGVFSDPEKAAEMSCEKNVDGSSCDPLDTAFPLEEALVQPCIDMVVQELSGARYAPEDKGNNASDDLGKISVAQPKSSGKNDK